MGGVGSRSHWRRNAKNTTEDLYALDVRRLHRNGVLEPHQSYWWHWEHDDVVRYSACIHSNVDHIVLAHQRIIGDQMPQQQRYRVYLQWTGCHHGGQRPWFLCPGKGCGRRSALLYVSDTFACRLCQHLVYRSQRQAAHERAAQRAISIQEALGWGSRTLVTHGSKPKGMHWDTFERLCNDHRKCLLKANSGYETQTAALRHWIERKC